VVFKITTNSGKDLTVDTTSVTLEGDAAVQVASLIFNVNGGDLETLLPTWSTQTHWRSLFNLTVTDSSFDFFGIDGAGGVIASARIGVHSTAFGSSPDFVRGDVNRDGGVDLSDVLATLFYLFGGLDVACADAADTDDNGKVNLGDAIGSLYYLFLSGAAPRSPFPAPGQDATADALGCRA